jgi:hypothetical protein
MHEPNDMLGLYTLRSIGRNMEKIIDCSTSSSFERLSILKLNLCMANKPLLIF